MISFSYNNNNLQSKLVSIVGYGTFITRGYWKGKQNVEVCLVKNFIRVLPMGSWYPYVLPKMQSSFWALKFDLNINELEKLDIYEGTSTDLFKRIKIEVFLKNNCKKEAYIYVPSERTIISEKLTPEIDKEDRWKKIINNDNELTEKFPELVL